MQPITNQTQIQWVSDRHLLLRVTDHHHVHHAAQCLQQAAIPGLLDITPADSTVLLSFNARNLTYERAESLVKHALTNATAHAPTENARTIDIPVCYDAPFAPDLAIVASLLNIDPRDIINLHTQAQYTVKFVGFVPGFAYLSGLPTQLQVPRLDSPRPRVPAGSVAIAGNQTAVYPLEVPGGWRLIGRTPLKMFDPTRASPSLLQHADHVKFVEISAIEFQRLAQHTKEPR